MSTKPSPTQIGLFIVIGVGLAVVAVLLVSSKRLFSDKARYVLYFDSSVKGLNPGAPVKFRGVSVGSVVEVRLRMNQAEHDLTIPVIIEVDAAVVREKTDRTLDFTNEEVLETAVAQGLRALLEAQSLLTGLLYVELGFVPNAPPPVFHQQRKVYREIPTAPTDIQEMMANIARMDIKGVTEKLNIVLARLDTSLAGLEVRDINAGFTNLLAAMNRLVTSPDLTNTLAAAPRVLEEFRMLSETLRLRVDPLADNANQTLREATATLAEVSDGVKDLREMLAPQAPIRHQLAAVLEDLGRAARSVSELAEFLKRNPNALISGRKGPESNP